MTAALTRLMNIHTDAICALQRQIQASVSSAHTIQVAAHTAKILLISKWRYTVGM